MSRNSALVKRICSWKVTSSKSVILLRAVLLTDRAQGKRRSLCACVILRHIRSTIFQSTSVACTAPSISSTLPPVSVSDAIAAPKDLAWDMRKSLRFFLVRRTRSSTRVCYTAVRILRVHAKIRGSCRWHGIRSSAHLCLCCANCGI